MARLGINYDDVKRAAEQILAQQGNPTVDNVRIALGGTGSKSTIAPLLKRWRQQNQQKVNDDQALPGHLLEAVRHLYEEMELNKREAISEYENACQQKVHVLEEKLAQILHEQAELAQKYNAVCQAEQELSQDKLQLQSQIQQENLHYVRLEAEHHSLQVRLQEQQADAQQLHKQLQQLSGQFEHYQQASAQLRQQERLQADQKQQALEHELQQARQQHFAQHEVLLKLQAEYANLLNRSQQAEAGFQAAQLDWQDSLLSSQKTAAENQELARQRQAELEKLQQEMAIAHQQANLQSQRQNDLLALSNSLRDQVIDLVQERKAWNQERQDLLHMLSRLQAIQISGMRVDSGTDQVSPAKT